MGFRIGLTPLCPLSLRANCPDPNLAVKTGSSIRLRFPFCPFGPRFASQTTFPLLLSLHFRVYTSGQPGLKTKKNKQIKITSNPVFETSLFSCCLSYRNPSSHSCSFVEPVSIRVTETLGIFTLAVFKVPLPEVSHSLFYIHLKSNPDPS